MSEEEKKEYNKKVNSMKDSIQEVLNFYIDKNFKQENLNELVAKEFGKIVDKTVKEFIADIVKSKIEINLINNK